MQIFLDSTHVVNLRIKFEVCIVSRSVDIEGVPKFKSRSRDTGLLPISPNFAFFWIAPLVYALNLNFVFSAVP